MNRISKLAIIKKKPVNIKFRTLRRDFDLLSLAIPAIIVLLLICYLPMFGIIIAFKDYHYDLGMFRSPWVGLKNFAFFFQSQDAFRITRNTICYNFAYIIITTTVSVTFAILLNEISKGWVKLYQTIIFVPYFISWVVAGYLVLAMLDLQYGFINRIFFAGMPVEWYSSPQYWPFILVFMSLWKNVGFNTLIYYTGIMGIQSEYYEAAEIDGASRVQTTFYITIPFLRRLIAILLIMSLGNIFRGDFGLHYFVPNNFGPLFATTDVIDTYVFRALRTLGDIPMASAVSVFQSIVGLCTILLANKVVKRIDEESSLF